MVPGVNGIDWSTQDARKFSGNQGSVSIVLHVVVRHTLPRFGYFSCCQTGRGS